MGHGCVIESSGTFPNSRIYRPTCAEFAGMRGVAQNCQINAAQFCATLSTTGVLGEGKFGERSAAVSQPSPASPIMTETLGELLTFVVKSHLPTGRLRQQHYINESCRRHEFCCGKFGSAWTWVEGRKTPRDSASFQLGNPQRGLR